MKNKISKILTKNDKKDLIKLMKILCILQIATVIGLYIKL